MKITLHHPRGEYAMGFIPSWLDDRNSMPAAKQLNAHYQHGGGWQPFNGFTLQPDNSVTYPDDPSYKPLASIQFRDELVLIYDHAWVAIVQPDRSFEICRMD